MANQSSITDPNSFDFAPGVLGVQDRPPSPLPRMVLRGLLILLVALLLWAFFGRLDIVTVAEGKLVPVSYLKIVRHFKSMESDPLLSLGRKVAPASRGRPRKQPSTAPLMESTNA